MTVERGGKRPSKVLPWWGEYKLVEKRTKNLDRLKALHNMRLDQANACKLMEALARKFRWPVPAIRFTGRSDRGFYEWSGTLVIRSDFISTWVLVHELAHHWNYRVSARLKKKHVAHGEDFVDCMDRLAEEAERLLLAGEIEWEPLQWEPLHS